MGTLRRNSQDQSEASLTSEAAGVLAAPDAHDSIAGDRSFVAAVKRQFLPGGTLSRATDGFVSRPGQVAFAESVARAIETHDTLVVEAGTGTGKTFAYGIPIVAHIDPEDESVQAVILAPTRELAMQITDEQRILYTSKPGVRAV